MFLFLGFCIALVKNFRIEGSLGKKNSKISKAGVSLVLCMYVRAIMKNLIELLIGCRK